MLLPFVTCCNIYFDWMMLTWTVFFQVLLWRQFEKLEVEKVIHFFCVYYFFFYFPFFSKLLGCFLAQNGNFILQKEMIAHKGRLRKETEGRPMSDFNSKGTELKQVHLLLGAVKLMSWLAVHLQFKIKNLLITALRHDASFRWCSFCENEY